jgi:uncharacterized phage protein gp47/JayE
MATVNDYSARVIAALALTEPDLDTSIGSPMRKVIDAFAGVQAEMGLDQQLSVYSWDIDSKSGGDLDDFAAVWGLQRYQAQRATGVVTFSRGASIAATRSATVGSGTQIMAATNPPVFVQTLAGAVLATGQVSVDLPVQAILAGPQGNVASGTLVNLASNVDSVTTVNNSTSLMGGAGAESDAQLRARIKATKLRSLAGTADMYEAMALQTQSNPNDSTTRSVTAVNVLGPKKTWTEQLQVVSGVASSSVTDATYIYPASVYVGPNLSTGQILNPAQYTATINNNVYPATLVLATVGANMPDGLYDLQFDYVPTYSRNDPLSTRFGTVGANINNRVDVWVNGSVTAAAVDTCVFSTASSMRFNTTSHDPMNLNVWSKMDGTSPSVNDYFVPLGFGPILSIPTTLSIGGSTYVMGTHYDIVYRSDAFGNAPVSRFGLVFYTAGTVPTNFTSFSIAYNYNSVPGTVQQSIESSWRLLGTDVWVHAGKKKSLRFHFAIIYNRSYDQSSVTTAINVALAAYVANLGFSSAMRVSDILQTVHNVPGVDNVRFLTSADDGTNYGIQLMVPVTTSGSIVDTPSTVYATGGRAQDIYFDDATYPSFDSTRIIIKARNTFGTS